MAFLSEDPNWDAGVYQIETTDPVLGGPNGTSNKPLKNLANRTFYLKTRIENLDASKAPLASPSLTGAPTAPTPAADANNSQIATTAFVKSAVNGKANTSHTHAIADVSGLQTALDGKLPVNGTAVALAGFTNGNSSNPIADPNAATQNGMGYVKGMSLFGVDDGALFTQAYSAEWVAQIFQDYRTGQIAARGKDNGAWKSWRIMLDTGNFNSVVPSLTGTGASGTWNIGITGNAASASAAPWSGITGKPSQILAESGFIGGAYNWNDVKDAGVYLVGVQGWAGSTNVPTNLYTYGSLIVAVNGGSITQLYITHGGEIACRSKWVESEWSAWRYSVDTNQAGNATPAMNGMAATGTSTRYARQDHVHPADTTRAPVASPALTGTPTAPTASADTNTQQLATTAFVLGQAGDAVPAMNGAAATGTSPRYSRQDHVHPADTTRAPIASPALTGTPTSPTAPVGTNTTQIATTAFATAGDALASPPGMVAHFARISAPDGWLKANGASVSRTTYAALFGAIGTTFGTGDGATTFNLPDLRGEFVRGWDDSRGLDAGRLFGSAQADEIKSHSHSTNWQLSNESGSVDNSIASGSTTMEPSYFRLSTNATGSTETRPRNVALLACIKY